jgi:predicted Na+-dependent transporter
MMHLDKVAGGGATVMYVETVSLNYMETILQVSLQLLIPFHLSDLQ